MQSEWTELLHMSPLHNFPVLPECPGRVGQGSVGHAARLGDHIMDNGYI